MINPEKSNSALDLAYLREMSGDSADFMIEMLDTMMVQIPLYLADVQKAVDAKDWTQAGAFAHKVKPTFYYVGRDDLRDYMQWIERSCKDGVNLAQIPSALAEVSQEMNHVMAQVADAKAKLEAQL
jgi:HPt (histidine-containing phosphotransfer) domain-containing protein